MITEVIGYAAGVSAAFFLAPQALETIKTKNVEGLSAFSYFIYIIGVVLWTLYGFRLNSYPMIIFNSISLFFSVPVLYLIVKYKKK